jgi:hypothetical protein
MFILGLCEYVGEYMDKVFKWCVEAAEKCSDVSEREGWSFAEEEWYRVQVHWW